MQINISVLFSYCCIIVIFLYFLVKIKNLKKERQELINRNLELGKRQLDTKITLECTLNTYRKMVELTVSNDIKGIWALVFDYMEQVLEINEAMLIVEREGIKNIAYQRGIQRGQRKEIIEFYDTCINDLRRELQVQRLKNSFLAIPIEDTNEYLGVLIVKQQQVNEKLLFVQELYSVILKHLRIEAINQGLLVSQEQNRIANEIHDGALQQLFGVSCHLYTLNKKIKQLPLDLLSQQLEEDRKIIQCTMTEIRRIIYGMSWNKEGENYFLVRLEAYIKQMEVLYDAQISLNIDGDLNLLSVKEKMVIYRIICEGLANSLRHGKAEQVQVILEASQKQIRLEIKDQGIGFDYEHVRKEEKFGLGIKNIEDLALSMGGHFQIESNIGNGTEILVDIPMVS